MARIARVVASGIPHHITQRGNRRQQTFLCEKDLLKDLKDSYTGCLDARNQGERKQKDRIEYGVPRKKRSYGEELTTLISPESCANAGATIGEALCGYK